MCNFKCYHFIFLVTFRLFHAQVQQFQNFVLQVLVKYTNEHSATTRRNDSSLASFFRLFCLFSLLIVLSTINLLPSAAAADVDECTQHNKLTSAYRSITYYNSSVERCDNQLEPGWYRFTEQAGRMMPTECVAKFHCGAYGPGWLDGEHPMPQDGRVMRRVCFHLEGECCKEWIFLQVRNCGNFMVYHLKPPPKCPLRYCGDAVEESSSSVVEGKCLQRVE